MTVKVVDASAASALLFGEPAADAIAAQLEGARLVAPALLPFEVSSVALKKIRRHPQARVTLLAAHALLGQLAIDTVAVNHDEVLVLAETSKLTAYDASYLWLVREMGAELVTLDKTLASAANTTPH